MNDVAQASRPRRFDRHVDGILLLDKPLGLSSNAVLQQARAVFRALKAGHAGSLDPLASGMLPICFGEATKVCGWLLDARKSYQFTARLGERTSTGDSEGEVVEQLPVPMLTAEIINAALVASLGEQQQIPPMYSALKHQGQRLYTLARRGETVERASRLIVIEQIDLVRFNDTEIEIIVRCSKGTYVRTFAEDLARRLGTTAHLTALRRLQVDPFAAAQMSTLEQLTEHLQRSGLAGIDDLLIPADQALLHLPAVDCKLAAQQALQQGKSVPSGEGRMVGDIVRLYGPQATFLGVGEVVTAGLVQPRRLWAIRPTHVPLA